MTSIPGPGCPGFTIMWPVESRTELCLRPEHRKKVRTQMRKKGQGKSLSPSTNTPVMEPFHRQWARAPASRMETRQRHSAESYAGQHESISSHLYSPLDLSYPTSFIFSSSLWIEMKAGRTALNFEETSGLHVNIPALSVWQVFRHLFGLPLS